MTAKNAIDEVNAVLPHNFDNSLLITWLNRIEKTAAVEIEEKALDPEPAITEANQATRTLSIPEPYAFIYPLYLQCMIYLMLGEYDRYSNLNGFFNTVWGDYAKRYLKSKG